MRGKLACSLSMSLTISWQWHARLVWHAKARFRSLMPLDSLASHLAFCSGSNFPFCFSSVPIYLPQQSKAVYFQWHASELVRTRSQVTALQPKVALVFDFSSVESFYWIYFVIGFYYFCWTMFFLALKNFKDTLQPSYHCQFSCTRDFLNWWHCLFFWCLGCRLHLFHCL